MSMKRKAPHNAAIDVSGHDLSAADGDDYFRNFFQRHYDDENNIAVDDVEILDVSRSRLGPSGISPLLTFLSRTPSPFPKLKRIYLQRNAIGSVGGREVGRFLSLDNNPDQTVEVLDISLNDIKAGGGLPIAAEIISDALKSNSTLKVLILDKCAVGPEGAAHLANALCTNNSLKRLELAGNMIGPVGGENLFNALKVNSSLEQLGLKMNRIGGIGTKEDVRSLSDALVGGCCRLTRLDLSYNDLRCSGCAILSEAVSNQHCTLRELTLEKNDISVEGSVALANALGANDILHKLILKGNNIGDGGAIAMGEMLKNNKTLITLDLSSCSIGNEGGAALGYGLGQNSMLEQLNLDKNSLGAGEDTAIFSTGVSRNKSLKVLKLSGNGFAASCGAELWDESISAALSNNNTLQYVDISSNVLSDSSIIDAVVAHSSIEYFDMSDNSLEDIAIETQLLLSKRLSTMEIDLSLNPLSSPPLGRLATHSNLESYLTLLASEKTAVTRIRLMVLGFGGVGKSTFCRAITNERDSRNFQGTLVSVQEWSVDQLADWAGRLGTTWSEDAVRLIVDESIMGKELNKLIDNNNGDENGSFPPSSLLLDLCSSKYPSIDAEIFARAISALRRKGYMSTVGAVKVDGEIELGQRTCSLVDFAGQVEFLVSHQLLLSSMHTLCMVIQPAPSFDKSNHRHFGSWNYWSRFLASLGDRRPGSLLLAVSQLDKLDKDGYANSPGKINGNEYTEASIQREFDNIKARSLGAISCESPLRLDYSPDKIDNTILSIKRALSKSTDQVAHSWWVPLTFEKLGDLLQSVAKRKSTNHELPILSRNELMQEIDIYCNKSPGSSVLLAKMKTDHKLLERAILYLEAVGDVLQASDELLIDPIGWFSSFLAHFIKDDLAVSTIQVDSMALRSRQRGTVNLDKIVNALEHEYKSPQKHVSQIMTLLCSLELCVPVQRFEQNASSMMEDAASGSMTYLFPCLLPPLQSHSELTGLTASHSLSSVSSIRGHRFRERSGFIPPGLFAGVLARLYKKLEPGVLHPTRMWKDYAILEFNNKATLVILRLDMDEAIIDAVGLASQNEHLFVGAAKGQASVVIWMAHLIKIFLRGYSQLKFEESWLCPNPQCHGIDVGGIVPSECVGSEFILSSKTTLQSKIRTHDCDVEGCWRFLGTGHSLERMMLRTDCLSDVCRTCNCEPVFTLRDKMS